MKAQLYDDADYVRIFDLRQMAWGKAIMDCHSTEAAPIGTDAADVALKRCNLKRKSKWKRFPETKMFEAQVSFK